MASCHGVREKLPDYIYELLSERELQDVSQHLDACRDCARVHAQIVRQFRLLDCWEVPGPRQGGFAQFEQAVRRQRTRGSGALCPVLSAWRQRLLQLLHRPVLPRPVQPRVVPVRIAGTAAAVLALAILPLIQSIRQQLVAAHKRSEVSTLLAQGRLQEAVLACRAWAHSGPEQTAAQGLLKALEMRLRRYMDLEARLQQVVRADPAAIRARLRLADVLRAQGKFKEAWLEYQRAVNANDACVEAYLGLAALAHAAGRTQQACSFLDLASCIAPDDPRVIATAARVETAGGGAAQAALRLRQAVQRMARDGADGLFGLAVLVRQTSEKPVWQ